MGRVVAMEFSASTSLAIALAASGPAASAGVPNDSLKVWAPRDGRLVLQEVVGPPEALAIIRDALHVYVSAGWDALAEVEK